MNCNEPIWTQNWTNLVWLVIFQIIQNPWRIRRSCNYKSCSKLHILSPQIFWEFSHSLAIFLWWNSSFGVYFAFGNNRSQAHLSLADSSVGPTYRVASPTWPPHVVASISVHEIKLPSCHRHRRSRAHPSPIFPDERRADTPLFSTTDGNSPTRRLSSSVSRSQATPAVSWGLLHWALGSSSTGTDRHLHVLPP
jgi:hypothetical protein